MAQRKGTRTSYSMPPPPPLLPPSDMFNRYQSPLNTAITGRPFVEPMPMQLPGLAPFRSGKELPNSNKVRKANQVPGGKVTQKSTPEILKGAGDRTKNKVKIEAPIDDIVELVRDSFEPVESIKEPIHQVDTIPSVVQRNYGEELPLGSARIEPNLSVPKNIVPEEESIYDRLSTLFSNPPTREENQPSKLRRIGGAIFGGMTGAAFGPEKGVETATGIVDKPYREAYEDWAVRTGALQKQAEIELARSKAETGGLSDIASYIRAVSASDPDLQGEIEGRKTAAREDVLEPGRIARSEREQEGRETIEEKRQRGREALEILRQNRELTLEQRRQEGRKAITQDQINAAEKRAKALIESRENIARLNRELRRDLDKSRNQRVPPSQQYLGRLMAENEVAKTISNKDEFEALFNQTEDSQGRPIITLKADTEVMAKWKTKYDERKKEIQALLKQIIGTSFNPNEKEFDIDDENENQEDEYDIEEID